MDALNTINVLKDQRHESPIDIPIMCSDICNLYDVAFRMKDPKKFLFYLLLFIAIFWFGNWMRWDFVSGRFVMHTE